MAKSPARAVLPTRAQFNAAVRLRAAKGPRDWIALSCEHEDDLWSKLVAAQASWLYESNEEAGEFIAEVLLSLGFEVQAKSLQ